LKAVKGLILRDKNAILEALRTGREIYYIGVSRGIKDDKKISEILAIAEKKNISIKELTRTNNNASRKTISIEAKCGDFKYSSFDNLKEVIERKGSEALLVAIDHVQDPRNLGAILRTAAAAGVDAVIIEKRRCCEVTDIAYETSCGGADRIPVVKVSNLRQTLRVFKEWGCWIAGTDERAEDSCYNVDLSGLNVLVLGSEGEGLSRIVSEECDFIVRIPTAPNFPSLNVSVAAGIMMFEFVRAKLMNMAGNTEQAE